MFLRLIVDQRGVFFERLVAAGATGLLEFMNGLRIEQMNFAILTPLILAAGIKHMAVDRTVGKGALVAHLHFLRNHVQPDSFDA